MAAEPDEAAIVDVAAVEAATATKVAKTPSEVMAAAAGAETVAAVPAKTVTVVDIVAMSRMITEGIVGAAILAEYYFLPQVVCRYISPC